MAFSPTHAMLALAMGSAIAPRRALYSVLIAGAACAVLPDVDLLLPVFGAGGREWHRTITHSLFFAVAVGLAAWAIASRLSSHRNALRVPLYLAFATASHGLLDAMTTYPIGVAFYCPVSWKRYAGPWQPIDGIAVESSLAIGLAVLSVALLRIRGVPPRFTNQNQHSSVTRAS
jgi:inner membrane protein